MSRKVAQREVMSARFAFYSPVEGIRVFRLFVILCFGCVMLLCDCWFASKDTGETILEVVHSPRGEEANEGNVIRAKQTLKVGRFLTKIVRLHMMK